MILSGAAIAGALMLSACTGTQGGDTSNATDEPAAAAPGEAAGFEEFPIGDDVEVGPLNVAAVYFQPVDMDPPGQGLPAADSDMHIEADISALKNELGFGIGDFVPFLTVDYTITAEDGTETSGTFMPMSASDGPHYGANIKLGKAGTYKVKFSIKSPADQGYVLHVDKTTGVTGRFWTKPLVTEWDFNYVPRSW